MTKWVPRMVVTRGHLIYEIRMLTTPSVHRSAKANKLSSSSRRQTVVLEAVQGKWGTTSACVSCLSNRTAGRNRPNNVRSRGRA